MNADTTRPTWPHSDRRIGTSMPGDPLDDTAPWETPAPMSPAQIAAAHRALRPVHYREAAESLRGIAKARLATAPDAVATARALGLEDAADLLDSTARDMEDTE